MCFKFQSPIHGSPTRSFSGLCCRLIEFQSPIHGSPTSVLIDYDHKHFYVSIPYTRVTNWFPVISCQVGHGVSIPYTRVTNAGSSALRLFPGRFQSPIHGSPTSAHLAGSPCFRCFNPLYTGHQHITIELCGTWLWSFNPLYTGHQRDR